MESVCSKYAHPSMNKCLRNEDIYLFILFVFHIAIVRKKLGIEGNRTRVDSCSTLLITSCLNLPLQSRYPQRTQRGRKRSRRLRMGNRNPKMIRSQRIWYAFSISSRLRILIMTNSPVGRGYPAQERARNAGGTVEGSLRHLHAP